MALVVNKDSQTLRLHEIVQRDDIYIYIYIHLFVHEFRFRELSFDSMFRERDTWRRFSSGEENEDKLINRFDYRLHE